MTSRKQLIKEDAEKETYKNGFEHGFIVALNMICNFARLEQRKMKIKENYLE